MNICHLTLYKAIWIPLRAYDCCSSSPKTQHVEASNRPGRSLPMLTEGTTVDRVWEKVLMTKLKSVGINGNVLSHHESHLRDRKLCALLDREILVPQAIQIGVRQRSILGLILWNLKPLQMTWPFDYLTHQDMSNHRQQEQIPLKTTLGI